MRPKLSRIFLFIKLNILQDKSLIQFQNKEDSKNRLLNR